MILYYSDVLSGRKACAAARYLKSPVEFAYLDLGKGEHKAPAYLRLNPNGKVPTLVDGDKVLWEADAVMCELARRAGSDLWPQDERQIDVIRWLSWAAQHFNRACGALYFEHIIRPRFNLGPADAAEVEGAQANFRRFATVLGDQLKGRTWLAGEGVTVADFAVGITLPYAAEAHIPLDEFPEVRRWHDQLNALEGWRDPFPQTAMAAA